MHYAGQPVAIVVADSHERAPHAASLVRATYERLPSITTLDEGRNAVYEPERIFAGFIPARQERGDVDAALGEAEVRVDVWYRIAANNHNALEPSATTAVWDGDRVIYDSTMGVRASQLTVAHLLGMSLADVRVVAPFVGVARGHHNSRVPTSFRQLAARRRAACGRRCRTCSGTRTRVSS